MNANKNFRVSISKGNSKVGAMNSVSLPPVITCPKGCPCAKDCYALKLTKIYPTVKKAYDNNLAIWEADPVEYMNQVKEAAEMQRFFRWHVSGDIIDDMYFAMMVSIAEELPHTDFLVFTKQYEIVNTYISENGDLPENLHIIFSEWTGKKLVNPYDLPVAHVIFKGCEPENTWTKCTGNCSNCARTSNGCFGLKKGQHVCFDKH